MDSGVPKPLMIIDHKPVIVHTVESVSRCSLIDSIILVAHESAIAQFEKFIRQYGLNKVTAIVIGGETRCDSVYNGLLKADQDTDMVLIHDGARPMVKSELLNSAILQCTKCGAVAAGVPVKSTIKMVNRDTMVIEETLDRSRLWEIQTPQVIKRDLLFEAYRQRGDYLPTDDVSLVEHLGVDVSIVMGDYDNIKITTKDDILLAENILSLRNA